MSRSYRVFIAALIGLTLQPVSNRCHAQAGASQSETKTDEASPVVPPPDLTPLYQGLERIGERIEALQPKPESADEYRRTEGDLKAQEDMAFWARWMTYFTGGSLIVSGFGVGLLIVTLRQNRRALRIALLGVKRSGQAVQLQKVTTQQELRAYVTFSEGTATIINRSILLFAIKFTNSGQTPAYKLRGFGESDIGPVAKPPDFNMTKLAESRSDMSVIGHGQGYVINVLTHINDAETDELRRGSVGYVWGEVLYDDAFGKTTRFFRYRCVTGKPIYNKEYPLLDVEQWRVIVHESGCEAN